MVFPLIYLTSSARFMSVRSGGAVARVAGDVDPEAEAAREDMVDFSNGRFMTYLGWLIWVVIVLANAYAIVTLAMGED